MDRSDASLLANSPIPSIVVGHASPEKSKPGRRRPTGLTELPDIEHVVARRHAAGALSASAPDVFDHIMPAVVAHAGDVGPPDVAHRKRGLETLDAFADKDAGVISKILHSASADAAVAGPSVADDKSPHRLEPLHRAGAPRPLRSGSMPEVLGGLHLTTTNGKFGSPTVERHGNKTLSPLSPAATARGPVSPVSPERGKPVVKIVTKKDRMIEMCQDEHQIRGKSNFHAKYDPRDVLYFRDIFRDMDVDQDGVVNLREFRAAMEKRGSALREILSFDAAPVRQVQYDTLFRHMDVNCDGQLTFAEILNLVFPYANERDMAQMLSLAYPPEEKKVRRPPAKELTPEQVDEISRLFQLYDEDGDGVLTLDEFRAATVNMPNISRDDVKKMMQNMDLNQDQVLTIDEFLKGMKRLYTHPEVFD